MNIFINSIILLPNENSSTILYWKIWFTESILAVFSQILPTFKRKMRNTTPFPGNRMINTVNIMHL